jgi:type I restriction enzyme S subunit
MTALVTKHLPLVAGAPDGIKNLRALILELAIKGKLVSHDPSEVSVDHLLLRISSVRDALAGKGQGRKTKPIERELEPSFGAPKGWQWVRLGDLLTKIGAGSTPLGGKQAYVASGIKFLRSQNVWNEGLRLDDVALIPKETHEKMSGTHVHAGDILFNITGASIGRCAIVPDSFDTGNVSQHVTIIRPCIPDICGYLHKVLMSGLVQDTVMAVQVGVSREGLSIGKLAQFPIPLPPLAEQHRIVAKVDELMALCDQLEADQADAEAAHAQLVQALLDSLTQATDAADFRASWQRLSEHFHTLFTTEASIDALKQTVLQLAVMGKLSEQSDADMAEPSRGDSYPAEARRSKAKATYPLVETDQQAFSIPDGWQWKRLGECAEQITDGEHLTPPRVQNPDAIPLVTAKNVRDGHMDYASTDFVERSVAEKCWQRCKPEVGDILMVSVGATLGRLTVLREAIEMVIVRSVALIKPSLLSADFMALTLRSPLIQRAIWASVKQSAQPCLYLKPASLLPVPVPPLPEQHRIVAKVDELMALCDQIKAQLAEARQQHAQLATALVEHAVA